ncbi:hypothetical protein SISSUDRAFT_1038390 [Sistotremastrum suecicum HHB10207 ss-3]|uniref:Uncharacterized protein n=1 Tax=Sistotremastrum suecicum HHB10207 ss-3 TaxID=1314776 RepID=A0A165WTD5_9AGAM|nr:hypothetical protein SISSUDRAFT_1038390 [Sistotremastrum suecicum HHB10207 ss-3]
MVGSSVAETHGESEATYDQAWFSQRLHSDNSIEALQEKLRESLGELGREAKRKFTDIVNAFATSSGTKPGRANPGIFTTIRNFAAKISRSARIAEYLCSVSPDYWGPPLSPAEEEKSDWLYAFELVDWLSFNKKAFRTFLDDPKQSELHDIMGRFQLCEGDFHEAVLIVELFKDCKNSTATLGFTVSSIERFVTAWQSISRALGRYSSAHYVSTTLDHWTTLLSGRFSGELFVAVFFSLDISIELLKSRWSREGYAQAQTYLHAVLLSSYRLHRNNSGRNQGHGGYLATANLDIQDEIDKYAANRIKHCDNSPPLLFWKCSERFVQYTSIIHFPSLATLEVSFELQAKVQHQKYRNCELCWTIDYPMWFASIPRSVPALYTVCHSRRDMHPNLGIPLIGGMPANSISGVLDLRTLLADPLSFVEQLGLDLPSPMSMNQNALLSPSPSSIASPAMDMGALRFEDSSISPWGTPGAQTPSSGSDELPSSSQRRFPISDQTQMLRAALQKIQVLEHQNSVLKAQYSARTQEAE